MPTLTVIAGPNGSGKSTITRSLAFPGKDNLLDPDAIAGRIAPADPSAVALIAGRLTLEMRARYLAGGIDFAIETTLAGVGVLAIMKQAKALDFDLNLIYIALKNAELSTRRVRERAAAGGHFVSTVDVRRRYDRSLANAPAAMRIADSCIVFDNSQLGPRKLIEARRGSVIWIAPNLPNWARAVLSDLESLQGGRS